MTEAPNQLKLNFDSPCPVLAGDAKIGQEYLSARGTIRVVVKCKDNGRVILKSLATGHDVAVEPDYHLREL